MEQDQGLGAGIQHEVATACLDGHAAIYYPCRDAPPVRGGGAEYQTPAAEIQQVIEAREKLLVQNSLDVGRQCLHGLHGCEQKFLIGSRSVPRRDLRHSPARHSRGTRSGVQSHLERGRKA